MLYMLGHFGVSPVIESWLCQSLAGWSWASHFTFLSLSFSAGVIMHHRYSEDLKWDSGYQEYSTITIFAIFILNILNWRLITLALKTWLAALGEGSTSFEERLAQCLARRRWSTDVGFLWTFDVHIGRGRLRTGKGCSVEAFRPGWEFGWMVPWAPFYKQNQLLINHLGPKRRSDAINFCFVPLETTMIRGCGVLIITCRTGGRDSWGWCGW